MFLSYIYFFGIVLFDSVGNLPDTLSCLNIARQERHPGAHPQRACLLCRTAPAPSHARIASLPPNKQTNKQTNNKQQWTKWVIFLGSFVLFVLGSICFGFFSFVYLHALVSMTTTCPVSAVVLKEKVKERDLVRIQREKEFTTWQQQHFNNGTLFFSFFHNYTTKSKTSS